MMQMQNLLFTQISLAKSLCGEKVKFKLQKVKFIINLKNTYFITNMSELLLVYKRDKKRRDYVDGIDLKYDLKIFLLMKITPLT